jgi:hypothetical protein
MRSAFVGPISMRRFLAATASGETTEPFVVWRLEPRVVSDGFGAREERIGQVKGRILGKNKRQRDHPAASRPNEKRGRQNGGTPLCYPRVRADILS